VVKKLKFAVVPKIDTMHCVAANKIDPSYMVCRRLC